MKYLKLIGFSLAALILSGCNQTFMTKEQLAKQQLEKEELGKILFFDRNLSKNRNQNCATCHNPKRGFIDDRDNGVEKMASLGDNEKSIGDRQAPTATYAMYSPKFHFDKKVNNIKVDSFGMEEKLL